MNAGPAAEAGFAAAERCLPPPPASPTVERVRAELFEQQTAWRFAQADVPKAVAAAKSAVAAWESVHGRTNDAGIQLAIAYNRLSTSLWYTADQAAAADANRKSLALAEKLSAAFPLVAEYRSLLGKVVAEMADGSADPEAGYERAAAVFERLTLDFPDEVDHLIEYGSVCNNAAGEHMSNGRFADALR
jgi:hypothetical protein